MKKAIVFAAILVFHISVFSQNKDNTLSPEEFAAGWVLLFDGETLNGWKAFNGNVPKSWVVKDNSIYCDNTLGRDDLMTIESYADFDLCFEWKIEENGNSGVIYRTREGKQWRQPYLTGPEFQVYGEQKTFSKTSTGSIFDVYATSEEKVVNPAMEWNKGRIRISNNLLTHWVNGVIVLQCQMHSEDWDQHVADSKWKDNPFFGKSPFGHIDFQNHGHPVWYKNVKILRL